MKSFISFKIWLIGLPLIALMIRASFWQADRYHQKINYIQSMQERMQLPIMPALNPHLLEQSNLEQYEFRRVKLSGSYDFAHEVVLRNRNLDQEPGVHLITPMKLDQSNVWILVNRGFIPLHLATREKRSVFQKSTREEFVALLKTSMKRRFMAPSDAPSGAGHAWNDSWLRVDLAAISKQLPYALLPLYAEKMDSLDPESVQNQIVVSSGGKEELLVPGLRAVRSAEHTAKDLSSYPLPAYDTVIPAGRHFEYIIEWAVMALLTFLICLSLQVRANRERVK